MTVVYFTPSVRLSKTRLSQRCVSNLGTSTRKESKRPAFAELPRSSSVCELPRSSSVCELPRTGPGVNYPGGQYRCKAGMWLFIVTIRSILWILISLVATLLMIHSLMSPYWLIGPKQSITIPSPEKVITYSPSIGVFTKCGAPTKDTNFTTPNCFLFAHHGLTTSSRIFPTIWKAATVLIVLGIVIMATSVFASVLSCCFQSVFKKSIFTTTGAVQVFAGIFFILGTMLFPFGWGEDRAKQVCDKGASPYYPGECNIGSGLYAATIGTALTLLSGPLAVLADKSTSTNSVQHKIDDGNTLICLI